MKRVRWSLRSSPENPLATQLKYCHCVQPFLRISRLPILTERLDRVIDPVLVGARLQNGRLVGFKLGYCHRPQRFYSWLGGVHPEVRRQDLARKLMAEQHDWVSANGYPLVETQTQATNNAMLILNLQAGFTICGYETNSQDIPVVLQRKILTVTASSC